MLETWRRGRGLESGDTKKGRLGDTNFCEAVRIISLRSLSTNSLGSICSEQRGQPSSETPIMVWATWEEMETRLENLSPNPMDFLLIKGFFLTDWVFPRRAAMSSLSDLSQLAWLTWLARLDFLPETLQLKLRAFYFINAYIGHTIYWEGKGWWLCVW